MQIKVTVEYHLLSLRMAIIKRTRNNICCQDVKEREPLYTFGGTINLYSHYRKHESFQKIKTRTVRCPANLFLEFLYKEYKGTN